VKFFVTLSNQYDSEPLGRMTSNYVFLAPTLKLPWESSPVGTFVGVLDLVLDEVHTSVVLHQNLQNKKICKPDEDSLRHPRLPCRGDRSRSSASPQWELDSIHHWRNTNEWPGVPVFRRRRQGE